ncbi:hypothetical protein K402DRAFT_344087 [Aulographum hederae CBS 113979]|uniref:Uncharacterized protein n=1 Tax=Aulographum hederae CBS 113979 TaxID=1176131 RepID=A0A6G1GIL1_9PEZI|nr:hypothetical protein K402DRAFT_344087 [Aulographum hederae CBS 113979]
MRVQPDEASVEVGKSQKHLHILEAPWWFPGEDGLDLFLIHFNALRSHNQPEVLDALCVKFTLLDVNEESCFAESG